jgi:glycosyltransferase involved in cell wall biosynthesis
LSSREHAPPCDVSVIIPTRNRPDQVRACLAALAAQTRRADRFEVIVVDDGSDQALAPVTDGFKDRLQVTLLGQTGAGPATARNLGAASARASLLAFTDDDCQPAPDWLDVLVARHQETPEAALGGHTINAVSGNVYSEASQLLVDYLYEYHTRKRGWRPSSPTEPPAFFTSNNLAVPARHFQQVAIGGGRGPRVL